MSVIEESTVVHAPQPYVFNVSQQTSLRADWDPFTRAVRYEGERGGPCKDAEATVHAWNGFSMRVRYISYAPPERAAIVMLQGPVFLRAFAGTWMFEHVDARSTRVRLRYQLKSKWGLEHLLAWKFRRDVRARLQGLKAYCEVGSCVATSVSAKEIEMSNRELTYPYTLYYDSACPLCNREMLALKARDTKERLKLVDIAAPDFDAVETGFELGAMNESMHLRAADGTVLRGLDAIQAAYEAVGLGVLYRWTRAPLLRPLMDGVYRGFARNRNTLSPFMMPLVSLLVRIPEEPLAQCKAGRCGVPRQGS